MIIEILGDPIPKKRHRVAMRHGHAVTYDEQSTEKNWIKLLIAKKFKELLEINSPEALEVKKADHFVVECLFILPIPKSFSKKERAKALWMSTPKVKPDVDNMLKFYLDAANEVLWKDDKDITVLTGQKSYGEEPKTIIKITGKKHMDVDEKAEEILTLFTPTMVSEIMGDVAKVYQFCGQSDITPDRRAALAAVFLSKISDKYADAFTKIKKKFPGFWETTNHKELT